VAFAVHGGVHLNEASYPFLSLQSFAFAVAVGLASLPIDSKHGRSWGRVFNQATPFTFWLTNLELTCATLTKPTHLRPSRSFASGSTPG
jgi:hypothetical protein